MIFIKFQKKFLLQINPKSSKGDLNVDIEGLVTYGATLLFGAYVMISFGVGVLVGHCLIYRVRG